VAKEGYKNLICFSGSRRGISDEKGWKNCVAGLKQIMPLAEKNNVLIVMELLNSKVDHKDYQCDKTSWGVELVKRLGSPNFKLLYDIYHMQIDEGDVIRPFAIIINTLRIIILVECREGMRSILPRNYIILR
jgi:hydroxypyruvate isomerase